MSSRDLPAPAKVAVIVAGLILLRYLTLFAIPQSYTWPAYILFWVWAYFFWTGTGSPRFTPIQEQVLEHEKQKALRPPTPLSPDRCYGAWVQGRIPKPWPEQAQQSLWSIFQLAEGNYDRRSIANNPSYLGNSILREVSSLLEAVPEDDPHRSAYLELYVRTKMLCELPPNTPSNPDQKAANEEAACEFVRVFRAPPGPPS